MTGVLTLRAAGPGDTAAPQASPCPAGLSFSSYLGKPGGMGTSLGA